MRSILALLAVMLTAACTNVTPVPPTGTTSPDADSGAADVQGQPDVTGKPDAFLDPGPTPDAVSDTSLPDATAPDTATPDIGPPPPDIAPPDVAPPTCAEAPTCECVVEACGSALSLPASAVCASATAEAPGCVANIVASYAANGCDTSCTMGGIPGLETLCAADECSGLLNLLDNVGVDSAAACASCDDCVPDCGGASCGGDGCGGECGVCAGNEACTDGACVDVCEGAPTVVECCAHPDSGEAGLCSVNSCSGQVLEFGQNCSSGECNPQTHACVDPVCVPDCDGKACGLDGCGNQCPNTCASDQVCDEAAGQCVCDPAGSLDCCPGGDAVCQYDSCGNLGGEVAACPGGCKFGACEPVVCIPNCDGKSCGPDGCNGTCGSCSGDSQCSAVGQCEEATYQISVVNDLFDQVSGLGNDWNKLNTLIRVRISTVQQDLLGDDADLFEQMYPYDIASVLPVGGALPPVFGSTTNKVTFEAPGPNFYISVQLGWWEWVSPFAGSGNGYWAKHMSQVLTVLTTCCQYKVAVIEVTDLAPGEDGTLYLSDFLPGGNYNGTY